MTTDFQPAEIKIPRRYQFQHPPISPSEWDFFNHIDFSREIWFEVGCGTGLWIKEQAQKNSDTLFIGVEKTRERSKKMLRHVENSLQNLTLLRANAELIVASRIPKQSLAKLIFFYPNPYFKRTQSNRRFFISSAWEIYDRALKPGGKVLATSNIFNYLSEASTSLEKIWGYQVECRKISPHNKPRTLFEKKYQERGETLWQMDATKPI